jgi:hypothetical protein
MGIMVFMMVIWFIAYFSPTQSVLITVNEYNEAWWELILLPVAVFCAAVGQLKIIFRQIR